MKFGHLYVFALLLPVGSTFSAPVANETVPPSHLVASPTLPGLTIPKDTKAVKVADFKNQQVASPTALAFGPNGELYIAETHRLSYGVPDNRSHLYWYLDDIASRTTEDRRKMHEKWQNQNATTSLEYMTAKSEKIRVLSDPDETGAYRKQHVFADGFNDVVDGVASGIFEYEGTVFLACIPKIHALRDADKDGIADTRDVIQDGFGVHVSLSGHDLNGFVLGADGRIYGSMGDRGFNATTREGRHYNLHDEGFVFRFDPDGSNFEIIHTGLRNPKELAFDETGNLITVDNNCDQGDKARVVQIIDGAYSGWHMAHQSLLTFHKQIGLENKPPARWMAERVWDLANSEQPASILAPMAHLTTGPAGLAHHPGTGFLASEAGRFLICDYRGGGAKSGIWSFKVEPSGAGMALADFQQIVWGSAVTDVDYSWDGKLTATDFLYGWQSHAAGHVYTVTADQPHHAKESAQVTDLIKEGFEKRSSNNLAGLLFHPDMRIRIRAQLALSRKAEGLDMFTKATAKNQKQITRLHGVWGLGIIARRGSAALPGPSDTTLADPALREKARLALLPLLNDSDAEIRAQAVKVIGESGLAAGDIPLETLIADQSPRVSLAATIAARRMNATSATGAILAMLEKTTDLHLRHIGSHALAVLETPEKLSALRSHASPAIRMAAVVALGRLKSPALADFLSDTDPAVADEAMRLINDHDISAVRPQVAALLDQSSTRPLSTMLWRRMLHSAFRTGDETNARRVLKVALDPKIPDESRTEAFRLLSEWTSPHPVDQSTGRFSPLPAREPGLIRNVLGGSITPLVQVDGSHLMAALALVQQNHLDLSSVTDEVLRNLIESSQVPGSARVGALNFYIERNPADLAQLIAKLADGPDDHLAIGAIRHLAKTSPQSAIGFLTKATTSGSSYRQQEAWKIAADTPGVAELIVSSIANLQKQNGISPAALELLDAAAKRSEPEVKSALAAFKAAQTASSDPLAAWLPSLEGGDAANGAKVFESHPAGQCMRCHAGGHGGGDAGPNLADIGLRADRRHMLESLVLPGAKVALGYGIASATLKGGKSVGGIVIDDQPNHVDFDSAGTILRVARPDIESMTPPISSMPPMNFLLSPTETRDVVAWLSEQKQKVRTNKKRPAPVLVTP